MRRQRESHIENRGGSVRRLAWLSLLLPGIVFLLNLEANYASVPFACSVGSRTLLNLLPPIALVLALGGGVLAWRAESKRTGEGGVRFLFQLGLLMSALFILGIVAQWLALLFFDPCL